MNKKSREQAIEELSLMLMYLTRFQDNNEFCSYMETSWKSYDFNALDELEKKDLLYQPKKSKCVYLSEEGKEQARKLLDGYQIADKDLLEKYEFRSIRPEEADQAATIEQICFPPNEACSEQHMKERIAKAPELFLVAVDKTTGRLAGFLNGLSTDEYTFRDDFFTDANLYNPAGKNIMLLGLDVLPEYRRQGIAKELVYCYARRERKNGRQMLILTCLKSKVKMYEKMGFVDRGIANSTWGGEEWHEMTYIIGM
jgi:ribosomal protein S18 acetylase RimI-like enzyme